MAAVDVNVATQLSAFWKEVYAKEVLRVYPQFAYIHKNAKFTTPEDTQGGEFIQPIIMSREHGWTYAGPNSGLVTLRGPRAASQDKARLQGSQLFGQGAMDYESAARSSKGKAAFVDGTKLLYENLTESGSFRQELQFLYGQDGLGVLASSADTTHFVLTAASFSGPTWGGLQNASVSVLSADGATLRGTANIASVDIDPDSGTYRTVTLESAIAGMVATDVVFFETAAVAGALRESLGLNKILTTTTGNLYGLSVTAYPYFRATSYAVGGALTVTHIGKAVLKAVMRGLKEDVELLISPNAYQGFINPLIDPLATGNARKIDASYKPTKIEVGTDSVSLSIQGIKVTIVPHMLVRDGDGFLLPMKRLKRVGAQEMSWETPGKGGEIFFHSPTLAAWEIRCYSNQALFMEAPGICVKLTGITGP
jgi:hypothetical protein